MDIAAISTGLTQMKVAQQVGISLLKTALTTAEVQTANLNQMLEANTKIMEMSVNPHLGTIIDVKL